MNYFSMFRQFFAVFIISGLPATGVWSQPPEQLEQHILQQLSNGNDVESLLSEWHSRHRPDRRGKRSFQSLSQQSAGQLPQALTELRRALERVLAKSADTRLPAELQTPYDAFRAADALIKAQFEAVTARLTEINADSVIRQRLQQAHSAYTATSDQILQTIDAGFHSAAQTEDLQRIIELLTRLPTATTSLLRTELPFRRFNPASRPPVVSPAIQPVYNSDESPVAGDLGPGPLTPLSEPILRQAAALDYDPVRIFEFVRNRIDSEWYAGAKYGAETTLALLRGNDVDQASLLIALLRASQIPARYVHGVTELPLAALADDLELTDESLVSAALTRAGVAFTPVIRGGRIAAVQIEYTWVAARVPYSNYRGAVVDFSGPVWLPLAPAFKRYQLTPAHAVLSQMAFDPRTLLDDYLSTVQTVEPLNQIREEVETFLAGNSDYAAQLGNRTLQPEQLQLLPNSLPFEVIAVTAQYPQLPPELQQQVRLSIQAEISGQSLFDVTLPLAKLNQRRVTLSYIPATVADHDTVNAFGGLSNTPAYLIELRPQLKIDGHPEAVAEHTLAMGANHRLMVELIAPAGSTATTQTLTAGSYYALAIGEGSATPSAEPDPDADPAPGDSEYLAARLLSHIAHYYNHRWRLAEQELAGLHRLSLLRPLPAVVIAGNAVELQYALDQPYALNWQGVNLDAALRLVEPVSP